MKSFFMDKSLAFLCKYNTYSDEDIEKLSYGLEGIYLTITKLIIIFALALLLNIFKEIIFLLISENSISSVKVWVFQPSGFITSNLTINPVPFNNGESPTLYLAKW